MAGSMSGVILEWNGKDLDARIIRGAPLSLDVVLTFGGTPPADVNGWYAELVATRYDGSSVLALTTANRKAAFLANGRIRFSETPDVTAMAENGSYHVLFRRADGTGGQLFSGKVIAIGDVYR